MKKKYMTPVTTIYNVKAQSMLAASSLEVSSDLADDKLEVDAREEEFLSDKNFWDQVW